eukprot:CAMPEP_0117832990 /NCGR_PEP_ID=MMETSP0949-20121206/10062_1 /TAXON_ID=44440 /ORGANISM="Chattonella subsalsa, Strain CCMP2191" /LENGTH=507 /DNA_ID=CAMNT_0005674581 /DNA_START=47 /DNA_END=1570 /DNA_ORIENTATION=+
MMMRRLHFWFISLPFFFLLHSSFIIEIAAAESNSYLGLPRSKYSDFRDAQDLGIFSCKEGGKKIAWEKVNDNFCDCLDGSDEPGTSACVYGTFYCTNRGHIGRYIPSSRVNDGICDCCDGSDEYTKLAACENQCEVQAAKSRQEQAKRIKELEEGARLKKKNVDEARTALQDRDAKLKEINTRIEENQQTIEKLNAEIAKVQESELKKWIAAMKNEDTSTIEQMQMGDLTEDNLREILVVFARITKSESLLLELMHTLSSGNDLYDIVVEKASQSAEKSNKMKPGYYDDSDEEDDYYDSDDYDDDGGGNHYDEDEEEDFAFVKDKPKCIVPSQYRSDQGNKLRRELEDTIEDLEDEEYKLKKERDKEGKDYGEHYEFWAMRDECFSTKVQQYTYEFCMYDKAKQKEGSSSVTLGRWKGLVNTSGKVENSENYYEVALSFEDGEKCWNGPKRSITVFLSCGTENKVLAVDEPEICVYHAFMTSPAACLLEHAEGLALDLLEEVEVPVI